MNPGKFFLTTIILLVVINDFKAEKSTTTLDEPLQKLTLISHLLNSIAIRNGFHSGYPTIHTGIAEMLRIPRTNSLLKFLDLDVASTLKLFEEFRSVTDKIVIPGKDELDKMTKLMKTLAWVTRYQGRLEVDNIEKAREKINKYQGTLEEMEENIDTLDANPVSWMAFWLNYIDKAETTENKDTIVKEVKPLFRFINKQLVKVLEVRKKLKTYFDLRDAIRTFKIFLEFSKEWNEAHMDFNTLEAFLSPRNRSFSSSIRWLPMELRNLVQTLSTLLPSPNQPSLSISFLETRRIKYELESDWFNGEVAAKNLSLEYLQSELTPVFNILKQISWIHQEWEPEIIEGFGRLSQNYTEQVALISDIFMDGGQISDFGESETECIQEIGSFEKINKNDYESMKKSLEAIEKKVDEIRERVRKIAFVVPDKEFTVIMTKLEPLKIIMENTTLSLQEQWDLMEQWDKGAPGDRKYLIEKCQKIDKALERPSSPDATSTPSPDASLDISDSYLKTVNITGVIKCVNESSLSKLDKLMRFLKNVQVHQGSKPILSKIVNLMEKSVQLQTKIRSVIEDAKGSGKAKFQGIQKIQKTAEDVSQGVQSLRKIQILLQNFESITNLTQNPDFNNDDRIKLVYLWRELQKYNETLASFPSDSNFSDLWSTVFGEAAKIRDIDFSFENILEKIEFPTAKNRDKILLASKAFKEVEEILERVMGTEKEEKVTVKEGFTSKYTPIPYKPPFAYNIFKIYYLEMLFVVTIVAFPLGLWLHEKSKEVILNSN